MCVCVLLAGAAQYEVVASALTGSLRLAAVGERKGIVQSSPIRTEMSRVSPVRRDHRRVHTSVLAALRRCQLRR